LKKENLIIHPTKKQSFKDSFVKIWYALLFFAFAELITPFLNPTKNYPTPFTGYTFGLISIVLIVYVLSQKIYQVIEIDYEKETFTVRYITLFKNDCQIVIPFEQLEYNYSLIISKTSKTWTLNIWHNDKNVFTLQDGDSGFDKEILDMIAEKLKELEDET
jgi:hypothetical protein